MKASAIFAQSHAFRLAENTKIAALCSGLPLPLACGMIAATDMKAAPDAARSRGESPIMKRVVSRVLASMLALATTAAMAQDKPPLKLGGLLDMSGLYADITG